MTPAQELERLREAWREFGRAICRQGAEQLRRLAGRLVRRAEQLEAIGYPQQWIGGARITSLEVDGRRVLGEGRLWAYRSQPVEADDVVFPSLHSAPASSPGGWPDHVVLTTEQQQHREDLLAMVEDERQQDTDDEEGKP